MRLAKITNAAAWTRPARRLLGLGSHGLGAQGLGALGLAAVLASGCTQTMPKSQPSAYTAAMLREAPKDVYPTIEGKLPAAAPQMTNDQAAEQQKRLSALSAQRAGGQISQAEYERRRRQMMKLAETHGQQTLDEIGSQTPAAPQAQ